jgi:hypothetical protein
MPMIMKCDDCGTTTDRNAGKDGITSTRGKLTVHIKLMKANGSEPIVCEHCMRLAAYYPMREVAV